MHHFYKTAKLFLKSRTQGESHTQRWVCKQAPFNWRSNLETAGVLWPGCTPELAATPLSWLSCTFQRPPPAVEQCSLPHGLPLQRSPQRIGKGKERRRTGLYYPVTDDWSNKIRSSKREGGPAAVANEQDEQSWGLKIIRLNPASSPLSTPCCCKQLNSLGWTHTTPHTSLGINATQSPLKKSPHYRNTDRPCSSWQLHVNSRSLCFSICLTKISSPLLKVYYKMLMKICL